MDYTQAQDAYNLALKEYEAGLNKPSNIYSNAYNGMLYSGMDYTQAQDARYSGTPVSAMNGFNRMNLSGGGVDANARARLDAARAALEQAKLAQAGALNKRYDRYTQQARDALYQGMKSYQPQALLSPSGNQYDVPQGNSGMYSNRIKSLLGG